MTRDELIGDITEEIKRTIPQNTFLDGDDLDIVQNTIESVIEQAEGALDSPEANTDGDE